MERAAIEQVVRAVILRMESEGAKEAPPLAPAIISAGKKEDTRTPEDACGKSIPVEISARHVHLCAGDLQKLFGTSALPEKKPISQPGQYLSEYRVRLIGPKGTLDNVAVLGPVRGATQAEISATDARTLGVKAPVRLTGDLAGAAAVHIQVGENIVTKPCAIIAKRHVHMTPEDAQAFHVSHGQEVSLRIDGCRPLSMHGVAVRVSRESALALHIDTDEANAAGAWESTVCHMIASDVLAGTCSGGAVDAPADVVSRTAEPEVGAAAGKLICERDVMQRHRSGVRVLRLSRGQIITPLALDALKACGMTLVREGQG